MNHRAAGGVERGMGSPITTFEDALAYLTAKWQVPAEHMRCPKAHVIDIAESHRLSDETGRKLFVLVDLRHRPKAPRWYVRDTPLVVLWAPADNGYAQSLMWAGRYTAARIVEHRDYYRPRPLLDARTLVVPVDAAYALAHAKRDPTDIGEFCDGPGPVIPNHGAVWASLERAAISYDDLKQLAADEAGRIT